MNIIRNKMTNKIKMHKINVVWAKGQTRNTLKSATSKAKDNRKDKDKFRLDMFRS